MLLFACYSLLFTCYSLLFIVYLLLLTRYSLIYFSFTTTYSLLITFYSLFLFINFYYLLVKLWKLSNVNPIQDGLFRGCSQMGGGKKAPLPKTCHTYPAMMKLGTVIPYLTEIQKIYESRDTPLEFCRQFLTGNQQI